MSTRTSPCAAPWDSVRGCRPTGERDGVKPTRIAASAAATKTDIAGQRSEPERRGARADISSSASAGGAAAHVRVHVGLGASRGE